MPSQSPQSPAREREAQGQFAPGQEVQSGGLNLKRLSRPESAEDRAFLSQLESQIRVKIARENNQ